MLPRPLLAKLIGPVMEPAKARVVSKLVTSEAVPPVEVMVPPAPSSRPSVNSPKTHWELPFRSSVAPRPMLRKLFWAMVLIPPASLSVPWLMTSWPVMLLPAIPATGLAGGARVRVAAPAFTKPMAAFPEPFPPLMTLEMVRSARV